MIDFKISIHATLAGSDVRFANAFPSSNISIHATLAGSDGVSPSFVIRANDFNPRYPRG